MAAVPITFHGMMYPKNKTVEPYAFTASGLANITGLSVGGGPILPPDEVPPDEIKPPLVIWGGPIDPYPGHPLPEPPLPPVDVPDPPPVPHEGWNWSAAKSGWYYLYVPDATQPSPKTP